MLVGKTSIKAAVLVINSVYSEQINGRIDTKALLNGS